MSELARRREARRSTEGRSRDLGDDALRFARWFTRGKYVLMEDFLGELRKAPEARNEEELEARFARAVAHGKRIQAARSVVTVLLGLGVVAAAFATLARFLYVPDPLAGDVAFTASLLDRVAALSASSAVVLVALRLAFDRYLSLVDVTATFLAMQLATARARTSA